MIFDTDVLIWTFRGNKKAAACIEESEGRSISVISLMELLQGARNGRDARLIKDFLRSFDFKTVPLTENIGHRAVIYMEQHALRSGLRVADALIAATAVENSQPLLTGDSRHFRTIAGLDLVAFKP
jgi:predicted nucleic acid-binding protein